MLKRFSTKTIAGAGLVAVGSLAVWFGTRSIVAQQLAARGVTVKYVETTFAEPDGAPLATTTRSLAVRSDGSRVEPRLVTAADGRLYSQKVIVDVQRKKRIVVDGVTESIMTTGLSDAELERLAKPGAACMDPLGKPGPAIQGYRTVQREIRTPLFVVHEWRAPELGCLTLRQTYARPQPDGSSKLVMESTAAEVAFGEPDPALFEVPDWPETAPSQALERYRLKFGLPDTEELRKVKESKDRAYWARQR